MKKHAAAKWKFLAAAFAALVMLCAQSGRAFALELRIHNDFDKKMTVAVVYFDSESQKWRTRGWYAAEPQSERKVSLSASKSNIYIYAQLSGSSMTWGNGDVTRTVTGDAFSYFDGETCPAGSNRRQVKFTKYTAANDILDFRPKSSASGEFASSAVELLNLINRERGKAGAPALRLDETMQKAANRRASELPKKYSHDRPDGTSYSTVFAEFNFAPFRSAENIAWRSGGKDHTSMASFNEAFMDSPGHRTNMLNPDYSIAGLGIVRDGDKYYVAELFAGN